MYVPFGEEVSGFWLDLTVLAQTVTGAISTVTETVRTL